MTQASIAATGELVLLTLSRHGTLYGVQITDYIYSASSGNHEINPGTLYPMLKKLRSDGLIRAVEKKEEPVEARAGKVRKYYELTDDGREALDMAEQTRQRIMSDGEVHEESEKSAQIRQESLKVKFFSIS